MKRRIEKERRSNVFFFFPKGNIQQEEADSLELINSFVPYCSLVDSRGFVRWKAIAMPTQDEIVDLSIVTKKLIEEANKQKK